MSTSPSSDITRTAIFGVWGLFTLILLFCVVMLVREMMRQGQDPLAAIDLSDRSFNTASTQNSAAAPKETREIDLFFGGTVPYLLTGEPRRIEVGVDTAWNCKAAIAALIAGSEQGLTRVLPPNAEIRGVYLRDGGELVVDFNRTLETDTPRSIAGEWMLREALIRTLSQPQLLGRDGGVVLSVRVLMEGAPLSESYPVHISLTDPFRLPNVGQRALSTTP